MARIWIAALSCVALGPITACSGSGLIESASPPEGTYSLISVDGAPLPWDMGDGWLLSAVILDLTENGEFRLMREARRVDGTATAADTRTGRWMQAGPQVTLIEDGSDTATATGSFVGDTLILLFTGLFSGEFVFRK